MPPSDEKLKAISEQLKRGVVPPKESVRSFLRWFSAERRGYNVVHGIRQQLKKYGLTTVPDFDYQYIDGFIGFVLGVDPGEPEIGSSVIDPTYRVGRLPSANRIPVSVKPDATLQQAVTLMLTHDYSQLPVMTTPRDVKGMVSWRTIGSRLALKRPCLAVRECMETAAIVSIDDSLFSAINTVAEHEYVLVQANDKTICGIASR